MSAHAAPRYTLLAWVLGTLRTWPYGNGARARAWAYEHLQGCDALEALCWGDKDTRQGRKSEWLYQLSCRYGHGNVERQLVTSWPKPST